MRWTLDELPLPRRLFEDVVEALYRRDDFMRGKLTIDGRKLRPNMVRCPLLVGYDPRSVVVPTESVLAFCRATLSESKTLIPYHGDTGVALQHIGPLIGDYAHKEMWPKIFGHLKKIRCAG